MSRVSRLNPILKNNMKKKHLLISLLSTCTLLTHAQGLVPDSVAYGSIPLKQSGAMVARLPERVDLSAYAPTAINQLNYGTCVSVSTTYYMRTILEAKRLGITNKKAIDGLRYSPSFVYNSVKAPKDIACKMGLDIPTALQFLKETGSVQYKQQGYPHCEANVTIRPDESSKIMDYVRLFGLTERHENIKLSTQKALAEGSPVVVGFQTTPSLHELGFWQTIWLRILHFLGIKPDEEYALWRPEKSDRLGNGHAVCVVGYDNAKFEGGAFKAINSYGEDWGDKGFFWIRYADYQSYVKYGYQAYVPAANDTTKPILACEVSFNIADSKDGTPIPFVRDTPASTPDDLVAYTLVPPLATGSSFQLAMSTDQQAFLYVVGGNDTFRQVDHLFPHDSVGAIVGAKSSVRLPDESHKYTLGGPPGTEYCLFLLSTTPIADTDLEQIVSRIESGVGSFPKRVRRAFGQDLVPPSQVKYKPKKLGFDLKGKHQGKIVPLMIRYYHKNAEGV